MLETVFFGDDDPTTVNVDGSCPDPGCVVFAPTSVSSSGFENLITGIASSISCVAPSHFMTLGPTPKSSSTVMRPLKQNKTKIQRKSNAARHRYPSNENAKMR